METLSPTPKPPILGTTRKVIQGSAEVSQQNTVYVFTAQGSQEPGMGMDLYNSSPAARAVWEGADAHILDCRDRQGQSEGENNPLWWYQGSSHSTTDMTYDTMDKDGHVTTLPLFAGIDVRCLKYTFSHPTGLLFVTDSLRLHSSSSRRLHLRKGFVQKDCAFVGHSHGEYSALASIADVLHIAALVDVVFYRGITM